MKRWWSPLRRRVEWVRNACRRGDAALFSRSLVVALCTPLWMRLSLPRLEASLAWLVTHLPQTPAGRQDPDAIAPTVLEALQAGRPLVRRGCLTRGLTLYYVLRRAGVDVGLEFGMGRATGGDGFDGHCWLTRDGEPYLEPGDPRQTYVTMYSFGQPGTSPVASSAAAA